MSKLIAKMLCAGVIVLPLIAASHSASAQAYPPPYQPGEAVPPPPPGPQAAYMVWQPGYWRWNGVQYVWITGHYVHAPRPAAIWVPGHWAARGGAWVWIPGHWG